jgi:hypothetical protein
MPFRFIPTFSKHCGETCCGAILTVDDPGVFRPFRAGLAILAECFRHGGTAWRPPPYEYVWDRMPIDILAGTPSTRRAIESFDEAALLDASRGDPGAHARVVGGSLMYDRSFIE